MLKIDLICQKNDHKMLKYAKNMLFFKITPGVFYVPVHIYLYNLPRKSPFLTTPQTRYFPTTSPCAVPNHLYPVIVCLPDMFY